MRFDGADPPGRSGGSDRARGDCGRDGVLSDTGELCLTVTSTRPNRPKISGLHWDTVADVLRACPAPARMRLAILDCCFAGQAIESLSRSAGSGLADLTHIEGIYTLTATTRNRTAHVPPPDQQGWGQSRL